MKYDRIHSEPWYVAQRARDGRWWQRAVETFRRLGPDAEPGDNHFGRRVAWYRTQWMWAAGLVSFADAGWPSRSVQGNGRQYELPDL